VLKTMPDESVHCAVTSPPYYGLRDYGTATWVGGDPACDHTAPDEAGSTDKPSSGQRSHAGRFAGKHCWRCGAERIDAQIGLEETPQEYVANLVRVFAEVRRVLRDDGTLWMNLGDTYCGAGYSNNSSIYGAAGREDGGKQKHGNRRLADLKPAGLKSKDLIGIPWMVAFALRADGWYLRQDIIWSKPNPMPESVTDRCTKAHEYLFLLTKSARYHYDADSIKEPAVSDHPSGNGFKRDARLSYRNADGTARGNDDQWTGVGGMRNRRSVWSVNTNPFPEAHFATFPPDLIEPCIKAGCPIGGTVLDPFGGAGTTGLVADRLQRNAVLIELNPTYADMTERRVRDDAPLFQAAV
jgi:DNA modification methylase